VKCNAYEDFSAVFQMSQFRDRGGADEAEEYVTANPKENYDINDFIELYHDNQKQYRNGYHKGLHEAYGVNGRTTAMRNGIKGNSSGSQDWG